MRLSDLAKWAIPARIVDIWRQRQGESLLPVQVKAVRKGLLQDHADDRKEPPLRMLISAPTSSGKSFCAEMAMIKALTRRQKAVMLVPLKALAEQQYRRLCHSYADLGIRCLIVTGDHPENDGRFVAGDFQLAIVIFEKFDLLLTSRLDVLKSIGLIVVDEIQTLSEPVRGAVLERLLTKILACVYKPSLLCLSAVIGDAAHSAGHLAGWLGATVVEETSRPVDLIRGIAADGSWRFRSHNNGLDGCESFEKLDVCEQPFDTVIRRVKTDDGQTLVFLKSRRDTVECAFRLAAEVCWPEAAMARRQLDDDEPSFLVRSLRQALTRSVAFHNADLSPRQRAVIEDSFAAGEIRVVFATTTLALGVDLPADTVYLETVKYSSGQYDTRPLLLPVSRSEFDNMTGRAGRLRPGGSRPGRAIVVAESNFDREVLWENYIAPDQPEPLMSAFSSISAEDWLLNLIAAGLIDNVASAGQVFTKTLFFHLEENNGQPDFEAALERLFKFGFISSAGAEESVTVTGIGRAAAHAGLSVAQARWLLNVLENDRPHTRAGWLGRVLGTPNWQLPPSILTVHELSDMTPLRMLFRDFDHLLDEASPLLDRHEHGKRLSYHQAARLKSFLLLNEWTRFAPVQRLEERYQMHLGHILALGDTVAHLVLGLARLAAAGDGEDGLAEQLRRQAFCLRFGMPATLEQLHAHVRDILHRGDLAGLYQAGVKQLSDLQRLPPERLEQLLPGRNKRQALREKLESLNEEVHMHPSTFTSNPSSTARPVPAIQPDTVEIDGTLERERYLVRINGFPVRLTGKSFKYFTRLAWWRLYREPGWIYKEDLEIGFNQARYLYRMKNEITSALTFCWAVIENNRLGYYRLNLDPTRIRINRENLQRHPDYEVRCLADQAAVHH